MCFFVVAIVVLLQCGQRGSRSEDQDIHVLVWLTAGAVWNREPEQLPDHSSACGPRAGNLMIAKEAAAPLVAQFCSVVLRAVPESSTSSLRCWPSE